MPTTPAEQPLPPVGQPHRARAWAESFGADAERYDRARPRYPDALIERIAASAPGPDLLDVGCGTGIAACQFLARGCRVLGVDVDERMARQARGHGLEVEVAKFEDWDPAGRAFDTVIAAQAWHWIDAGAGARKAARVLRPGGRFAVFWNVGQPEPALAEAFGAVYRRVVPDNPIFGGGGAGGAGGDGGTGTSDGTGDGRAGGERRENGYAAFVSRAIAGLREAGGFGEPEEWTFAWERTYTRDEWLDVVPTTGGHSLFRPEQLARILEGVGAAIDAGGGAFTMRYVARVATAVRAVD